MPPMKESESGWIAGERGKSMEQSGGIFAPVS